MDAAAAAKFTTPLPRLVCSSLCVAAQRVSQNISSEDAVRRLVQAASGRMLAGGRFFVASNSPGFVTEAMGKGAGLIAAEEYPRSRPSAADVVIVSWCSAACFPPDGAGSCALETDAMLEDLAESQALVVGIGPMATLGGGVLSAAHVIDTELSDPLSPRLMLAFGGSAFPIISLANILTLWAFTAELISACARNGGKMLAVYQSVLVPGGRERNAARLSRFASGDAFEPGDHWAPLAAAYGELTARDISATITALESLNWTKLEAAIQLCGAAVQAGGRVITYIIGHSPVHHWGTAAGTYHVGWPGSRHHRMAGMYRVITLETTQLPDAAALLSRP